MPGEVDGNGRYVARAGKTQTEDGLVGTFDWPAHPETDPGTYRVAATDDATGGARAAARDRVGAMFLSWARFPCFRADSSRAGVRVRILAARCAPSAGAGFGTLTVEVR